jgi:hypothetical protein
LKSTFTDPRNVLQDQDGLASTMVSDKQQRANQLLLRPNLRHLIGQISPVAAERTSLQVHNSPASSIVRAPRLCRVNTHLGWCSSQSTTFFPTSSRHRSFGDYDPFRKRFRGVTLASSRAENPRWSLVNDSDWPASPPSKCLVHYVDHHGSIERWPSLTGDN